MNPDSSDPIIITYWHCKWWLNNGFSNKGAAELNHSN